MLRDVSEAGLRIIMRHKNEIKKNTCIQIDQASLGTFCLLFFFCTSVTIFFKNT